jgi:hypothetical protein
MMRQSDARHRSKSRRHVSNRIAPECATNIEGLTWIRSKIDGVRVRLFYRGTITHPMEGEVR